MPEMPFGPLVRLCQLMITADDLAEGERDDGKIVAAQPQHRKAEQHAPERGQEAGERQAHPERPAEICGDQRVGVGADRVEGDVAEVEQAGETDHDVQAPAEHHVGEHQDAEVEEVAVAVKQHRHDQREAEGRPSAGIEPPNLYELIQPVGRRHERRRAVAPDQCANEAADKHRGHEYGDPAEPRGENELAAARSLIGANADHEHEQPESDQSRERGLLHRGGDIDGPCRCFSHMRPSSRPSAARAGSMPQRVR